MPTEQHYHVASGSYYISRQKPLILDAIRYHHRPEDAARNLELTHTVYLADLIMSKFNSGLELEWFGTETLSARLEAVGLSADKFPDIIDLIPIGVFESSPELALRQK